MHFSDVLKNIIKSGFSYPDISTTQIVVCLLAAYILAMYVHAVYRFTTKNTFYNKNFGTSMALIAVITAGIIMAIQSSLVISLGMVGALSIVRFRTAIKDPMDLLFLFWSISIGIICGAGLFELAIIMCIVATLGILIFKLTPFKNNSMLLVLNSTSKEDFPAIMDTIESNTSSRMIKAKNVSRDGMELIVEVRLKGGQEKIVDALLGIQNVQNVHLLENDTDVKNS